MEGVSDTFDNDSQKAQSSPSRAGESCSFFDYG